MGLERIERVRIAVGRSILVHGLRVATAAPRESYRPGPERRGRFVATRDCRPFPRGIPVGASERVGPRGETAGLDSRWTMGRVSS